MRGLHQVAELSHDFVEDAFAIGSAGAKRDQTLFQTLCLTFGDSQMLLKSRFDLYVVDLRNKIVEHSHNTYFRSVRVLNMADQPILGCLSHNNLLRGVVPDLVP